MRIPGFLRAAGILGFAVLCAGNPAPADGVEVIPIADPPAEVGLSLRAQSDAAVEIHFGLDRFDFSPVAVEGVAHRTVTMEGAFLPNDAGAPDLPGLGRYIAVPAGAQATVKILTSRTQRLSGVAVAPAPVIPRENDDAPLVYQKNAEIYGRDAYYPESPVLLSPPMKMRGVDVVILGVTPFQYNPVTQELLVYTEIDLRVEFQGGRGAFGEDRLRSRYWEPILEGNLLNYESLPALDLSPPPRGGRDGYEYVIITPPDAGFVAWADTLKAWRQLQGISTGVFTTNETGSTAAAIEGWLNNAYNNWGTPPAAFLLLGDYPNAESGSTGIIAPIWNSYCVSDNIYADVNGDNLPDMAHARICGRNAGELGQMITKMLDYERAPYTDPAFYDRPVIAGGWQTERWFILCTEVIYGHQANVLGKHPTREYAIYSGTPGSVWSTATNTSTVVNYFGPNGLGYIPATPSHLTDWGGNATRLNSDLNAGAYMLMHRDHGYEYGWGEPDYDKYDLDNLSNSKYPFVFSINCLTGKYNYTSETFTERFHRMNHGAVGLIGASEVSYSFVNDTFVWGLIDGMWPDFMPDYGPYPHGPDPLRTCFGMCHGKYFLQASNWPYNTSNKTVTYHLFHHHGDAYLRMYSAVPQPLAVVHASQLAAGASYFTVQANAGAVVSLTVSGAIIGVATATGSPQDIPIIPQAGPGTLRVTVTAANCYRYDQSVPIESGPPEPPLAEFSATPLSGTAPLAVVFSDLSSGSVTSWDWSFGDGGTASVRNPTHEYLGAGTYTVSLTVSGAAGSDGETKIDYITVAPCVLPVASFAATPRSGDAPLTVQFTDTSSGAPVSWSWDFGDGGTASVQNPAHTYLTAGSFTVTLTVANACGPGAASEPGYITVSEPSAVWTVITSDDFEAGMGNYTDGGVDMLLYTGGAYAHQGSAAADIQDNSGTASSFYHTLGWDVRAYSALEVEFWFLAQGMEAGEDFWVQYYDGSAWRTVASYASGTSFSNGRFYHQTVAIPASQYAYPAAAKLRFLCDASGDADDVYIDEIIFRGFGEPLPPVAAFSAEPTSGTAPLSVAFTDQSLNAPTAWVWDFGDGGRSTGQHPAHVYELAGTYTVTLTASNGAGADGETKVDYITVTEPGGGSWVTITYDDFETGMGSYADGGGDMARYTSGTYAHQGTCAADIQDNSGVASSFYHAAGYNVSGYSDLEVAFWFRAQSMESGEDFWVQYYDGAVWRTVASYVSGTDFSNSTFYNKVVTIPRSQYNYPANAKLRFMCDAGDNTDDVYIDEIEFRGFQTDAAHPALASFAATRAHQPTMFRSAGTVSFALAEGAQVQVAIYDLSGRRVASLVDRHLAPGQHSVQWEPRGEPAGAYFYRVAAGDEVIKTGRLILVR